MLSTANVIVCSAATDCATAEVAVIGATAVRPNSARARNFFMRVSFRDQ